MIRITLGTATERNTKIVEETSTIRQILSDNNMPTSGQTFHLDGVPLTSEEMDQPLSELVTADEALLICVPAQKAGR